MRRKVLLINNGYPSKRSPQYSTYIETIHQCLKNADVSVSLLVLSSNLRFKMLAYLEYYFKLLFTNYSLYDSVYIHNYPHSFLPLIFHLYRMKRIVFHWHGTDICAPNVFGKILNKVSYNFIPLVAQHIAPSKYFANIVSETLSIDKAKITVSPSGGIDTDKFQPSPKPRRNKALLIGFASSMRTDKGMDYFIRLIEEHETLEKRTQTNVHFICINYGGEKELYSKKLALFENVTLLAPMPKNKMHSFYQELDLLLLPSRMSESLALVGLEAMSCNVPVVGTNDFAIKEYIIDGVTGEKFEKGNFSSFVDSVVTVVNNLGQYQPRNLILQRYSRDIVIKQYEEIFS